MVTSHSRHTHSPPAPRALSSAGTIVTPQVQIGGSSSLSRWSSLTDGEYTSAPDRCRNTLWTRRVSA